MKRKVPEGMTRTDEGYLRIKRRGPLRDKMAHRLYVERQAKRPLRDDEEVHHVCMNRACWPPTNFHLCLCDAALAQCMFKKYGRKRRRRKYGAN